MDVKDYGSGSQFGMTSMEMIHRHHKMGDDSLRGKVSAYEDSSGNLYVRFCSDGAGYTHDKLLNPVDGEPLWMGGAFFIVDWHNSTVSLWGESQSIGPLPNQVKPTIVGELQKLLDQFLAMQSA